MDLSKPINVHYSKYSSTDSETGETYSNKIEFNIRMVDFNRSIEFGILSTSSTTDKDGNVIDSNEEESSINLNKESVTVLMDVLAAYVDGDRDDLDAAFEKLDEINRQELKWKEEMKAIADSRS